MLSKDKRNELIQYVVYKGIIISTLITIMYNILLLLDLNVTGIAGKLLVVIILLCTLLPRHDLIGLDKLFLWRSLKKDFEQIELTNDYKNSKVLTIMALVQSGYYIYMNVYGSYLLIKTMVTASINIDQTVTTLYHIGLTYILIYMVNAVINIFKYKYKDDEDSVITE